LTDNLQDKDGFSQMSVRRFQFFAFLLGLTCVMVPVFGQEPFSAEGIPPSSDYVYRQHYEQVQEILKTPDLAERERRLEAYRGKLHPEAKINQYMEAFFGQIVQDYQRAGQNDQAQALTQKMARWFPASDALVAQQFKTAFDGKDHDKAIELGEKLRATSPNDPQVLVMLAQSYQAKNNTAKVVELSPKLLEVLGPRQAVYYAVLLADHHRTRGDAAQAGRYYDMALEAYPNNAPEGWQASQWEAVKTTAYQVRATNAWGREDFRGVIQAYNQVLRSDPRNDAAHLFIGLSHWKLQELDQAQEAFAKATVLGKSNADRARQYLEQIYGPRNNNSLEGLDKVLDKARADLRL
jgi:tetratricopeptide (TPR) repeat protein